MFVFVDLEVKIVTKPFTLMQNVKTPFFEGKLAKLENLFKDSIKIRNPR